MRAPMSALRQLDRIEQKRTSLLDAVARLEPSRLDAHPVPGKWSIREIIEHLVLAERSVLGDLSGLQERPRSFRHRVRYLIVMGVLRGRIPVRAPSTAMLPTGERSLPELRETWDESHRRLRAYVSGLDRRGLRRAVFRHPFAGPLPVPQALRMLEAHLATHTRQIDRLRGLI